MTKINENQLKTSSLLFDEAPLLVRPEMAKRIGLNEAIVVQQIHYWLENKRKSTKEKDLAREKTYIDGRFWTYDTYANWQEQFPWWSVKTVERIFVGLEKNGILLSGCFNEWETDRTKWYTIDYNALDNYKKASKKKPTKKKKVENVAVEQSDNLGDCETTHSDNLGDSSRQVGGMVTTTWGDGHDNLTSPIPKTSTKTSDLDLHSKNSTNLLTSIEDEWAVSGAQHFADKLTVKLVSVINELVKKYRSLGLEDHRVKHAVVDVFSQTVKKSFRGLFETILKAQLKEQQDMQTAEDGSETVGASNQPKTVRKENVPAFIEEQRLEEQRKAEELAHIEASKSALTKLQEELASYERTRGIFKTEEQLAQIDILIAGVKEKIVELQG